LAVLEFTKNLLNSFVTLSESVDDQIDVTMTLVRVDPRSLKRVLELVGVGSKEKSIICYDAVSDHKSKTRCVT